MPAVRRRNAVLCQVAANIGVLADCVCAVVFGRRGAFKESEPTFASRACAYQGYMHTERRIGPLPPYRVARRDKHSDDTVHNLLTLGVAVTDKGPTTTRAVPPPTGAGVPACPVSAASVSTPVPAPTISSPRVDVLIIGNPTTGVDIVSVLQRYIDGQVKRVTLHRVTGGLSGDPTVPLWVVCTDMTVHTCKDLYESSGWGAFTANVTGFRGEVHPAVGEGWCRL